MVTVMITLAGLAVPAILTGLDDVRTAAAARYVASMARLARMQAVTRSATVGIHFQKDEDSYRFAMYIDGNFNGIRTADIAREIDRMIRTPQRIEDQFPGMRFGIAAAVNDDPIRLGRNDIMTFTPTGTATSGTVYIRSRTGRQFAVRIFGATGRTRILEFNFGADAWRDR